jgi:hypothetical protein
MRKVHAWVLGALALAILFTLFGDWRSLRGLEDLCGELDLWAQRVMAYPTLAAFLIGIAAVYLVLVATTFRVHRKSVRWLEKLAQKWIEGVYLRNKGFEASDLNQLGQWIVRYQAWYGDVLQELRAWQPIDATFFEVVGHFEHKPYGVAYINDEHRLHVETMSEQLGRLRHIIEKYQKRERTLVLGVGDA